VAICWAPADTASPSSAVTNHVPHRIMRVMGAILNKATDGGQPIEPRSS
jgi:hypothetical protein